MSNLLTTQIGKKLIMSLSGLFLILFLLMHLSINLLTLVGAETFNEASHFMSSNPFIYVMQYVLAAGFLVHIVYSLVLTYINTTARPVNYKRTVRGGNSTWMSRNMIITGLMVLAFLVLHLINYFVPVKFEGVEDHYTMVVSLFGRWYYVLAYVLAFVLLFLHLVHAFESAFQTLGLNNHRWQKRLMFLGYLYSFVVCAGFSLIAIWFFVEQ